MDTSALESTIRALEIRSDSLDSWLKFWITLVVIGVVAEVFVVIREYLHARSEYSRGWIRSPSKPTLLDLGLGLAGGVLVAMGVAGELGIDFKAAAVGGELRNANRSLVGLLNAEAATARKDAGKAIERASRADERASANGKEAARLRKTAEDEAAARARIEESVKRQGSRGTLLNEPHLGNDAAIQAHNGQNISIFVCDDQIGNEEKMHTGMTLWVELTKVAKWNATGPVWSMCGGSGINVFVSASADHNTRSAANDLASVMRKSLLSSGPIVTEWQSEWKLVPKPPTPDTIVVLINRHAIQ